MLGSTRSINASVQKTTSVREESQKKLNSAKGASKKAGASQSKATKNTGVNLKNSNSVKPAVLKKSSII